MIQRLQAFLFIYLPDRDRKGYKLIRVRHRA
jgi:hypothetical protein